MTEIFGTVGTGVSGTVVATTIYWGAVAVNKDATKEAKHDVAQFIKGFRNGFDISLIARHISDIFEILFGRKHISKRCISRSILMTFFFFTIIFVVVFLNRPVVLSAAANNSIPGFSRWVGWQRSLVEIVFYLVYMCSASLIPDFISLWKSRILLRRLRPRFRFKGILIIYVVDILLSFVIFMIWLGSLVFLIGKFKWHDLFLTLEDILPGYALLFGYTQASRDPTIIYVPLMVTSTLLTSIWTLGVLISSVLVRCLLALRYPFAVLTWLFDVEEQSIKIVGIVLAALAWILIAGYGML